jgi:hypothetical protein
VYLILCPSDVHSFAHLSLIHLPVRPYIRTFLYFFFHTFYFSSVCFF